MNFNWLWKGKNKRIWNLAGLCCIALWGYVAVSLTMLGRSRSQQAEVELRLFWCIKEAWTNHDAMDWYLIVGNMSLFIPLGVVLAVFYPQLRTWWKAMVCGFMISLSIEITQFLLHLGLFELDDLLHNTIGTYLGYCLCVISLYIIVRDERKDRTKIFIISCLSWAIVFGFFATAIAMGQPVFGWLGL